LPKLARAVKITIAAAITIFIAIGWALWPGL
jgi:hypothetical protein